MLRTSTSTDSSTSATQIVVEYDGVDDGGGRSGDFDRKFHQPLTSRLRTSSSTDSSTSVTQSVVKYDEVDASDKSVKKVVKKSEKPQRPESCKSHRFRGMFTKAAILFQRTRASVGALTVFRALFAWSRSSFDTTFGAIIVKAKLIELLMRCLH